MNPPMHTRVRNHFVDAGLTVGFITQLLMWNDTGKKADAFIVFRPGGGTPIDDVISAEYYVMVDVVGAKGANDQVDSTVQAIIDYVKSNPIASKCLGQITNIGGIPPPTATTEGRLVFRLMFSCLYGE